LMHAGLGEHQEAQGQIYQQTCEGIPTGDVGSGAVMPEVPSEAMSGDAESKDQKRFVVTEYRKTHENSQTNKLYCNVGTRPPLKGRGEKTAGHRGRKGGVVCPLKPPAALGQPPEY